MSDKWMQVVEVITDLTEIAVSLGKALTRGDMRTVDEVLGTGPLKSTVALAAGRARAMRELASKRDTEPAPE